MKKKRFFFLRVRTLVRLFAARRCGALDFCALLIAAARPLPACF